MSNDEKMRQAIQKVYANLEARDQLVCEMANKWQGETRLPMNIWIDDSKSYIMGGHFKRIKFQLDKGRGNPHNCGTMDLDGNLHPPTVKIDKLSAKDMRQLRNFVHNNRYALEHIADVDIYTGQIWDYMIKGGERVSDEAIAALNRKVDEIMADNNLRSTVQVRPRPATVRKSS